jgi:2-methylisocitrate lyase-like PEP mutase family enzyme
MIVAPGCYDRVTIRLAAEAGLGAAYLGPFGVLSTIYGGIDPRRWSFAAYAEHIERVADQSPIPLIADGHIGIEGGVGVSDVVSILGASGVAAVAIEDREEFWQPMIADSFLSREGVRRHIQTALEARTSDSMLLIVRTDSTRISLDEALKRCEWFLEDGASLVMPLMSPYLSYSPTPLSYDERLKLHQRIVGALGSRAVTHSPLGLDLTFADARRLGYAAYVIPQLAMASVVPAVGLAFSALAGDQMKQFALSTQLVESRTLAQRNGIDQWLSRRW